MTSSLPEDKKIIHDVNLWTPKNVMLSENFKTEKIFVILSCIVAKKTESGLLLAKHFLPAKNQEGANNQSLQLKKWKIISSVQHE